MGLQRGSERLCDWLITTRLVVGGIGPTIWAKWCVVISETWGPILLLENGSIRWAACGVLRLLSGSQNMVNSVSSPACQVLIPQDREPTSHTGQLPWLFPNLARSSPSKAPWEWEVGKLLAAWGALHKLGSQGQAFTHFLQPRPCAPGLALHGDRGAGTCGKGTVHQTLEIACICEKSKV